MNQKTCLITGANSGIGKQAAIQLAQAGFCVIVGCRNKERGEMAKPYVYLATSSELNKTTGKYFNEKNKIVDASPYAKNKAYIQTVMDMSLRYVNKL